MAYLDSPFGRSLGALVAASLLVVVSPEVGADPGSKGVIKLALGQAAFQDGFYLFKPATPSPPYTYTYTGDFQQFSLTQKCIVDTGNWRFDSQPVGPKDLIDLKPIGPLGSSNFRAGLLAGSLGVYDNSKGVSCSRMTASIFEGLEIKSLVGGFDRLELDMELKGNAVFKLTINPGSSPKKEYLLYSGTSRKDGVQALDSNGFPAANPASPDRNCAGSSDSGPDSGPSDNCRWVIDDVGSSFRVEPFEVGEGSLEGGGDFGSMDFATKIYLTSLIDVGNLGCLNTNNKTAEVFSTDPTTPAASCQVTRINTNDIQGGTCNDLIPYRLETFTADNLCKLDKTADVTDQLAGSLRVTFNKEPRTDWGVAQTDVTFTGQASGVVLQANRCAGSVVPDPHGNRTIEQVSDTTCKPVGDVSSGGCNGLNLKTKLVGTVVGGHFIAGDAGGTVLSDYNDEVPGNGYIDWACVLDHTETYVGDGSPATPAFNDEDQEVKQTLLFWGDVGWARY